ncbi:hypothetical protein [Myxococcus faecalis]|uniref:hypothetical protein n=1 Tax=Myxococcus faecalis TaxID=3115646 RepID=UPI003CF4B89E
MLIVYQSLESTGSKDDRPSTFITGNSFKRKVHHSLPQEKFQLKSREYDVSKNEIVFKTTESKKPFASYEDSDKLSKAIKELDPAKQDDIALQMLDKIIERIVDNAATCTRPPGNILPFTRIPDVIVLGEIYASSLKGKVFHRGQYVVLGGMDPTRDARHRFTVLVRTRFDQKNPEPTYANSVDARLAVPSDKNNTNEHSKCMMLKVRGWLIAFVHTPNAICNDDDRAAEYLHNNALCFGSGAKLDLVIGDTNQASTNIVKNYMNKAYSRKVHKLELPLKKPEKSMDSLEEKDSNERYKWDHSIISDSKTGRAKQLVRGYTNYEVSGTNSGYDKHFDIACTSRCFVQTTSLTVHATQDDELTHTVSSDSEPVFFFHGLTDKFFEWEEKYFAYSDHNGVIVEILRDKQGFRPSDGGKRRGGAEQLPQSKKLFQPGLPKPTDDVD